MVVNTAKEYVIEGSLTFKNATLDDFGVYTCSMENDLGRDEMKILLVNGGMNGSLRPLVVILYIADLPRELVVVRLVLAVLGVISCVLVVCVAVRCYKSFQNSSYVEDDNKLHSERFVDLTILA